MRRNKGRALMAIGLALMLAALAWTGWNLYTEQSAGAYSGSVADSLRRPAPTAQTTVAVPDTTAAPDAADVPAPETTPASADSPEAVASTAPVQTPSAPLYATHPDMEMPVREIDGQTYVALIDIPALGVSLPVMSDWSYPQLKLAPCRFWGSAYADDLIVIAHNYSTHFGGLKDLLPGDEVSLTDMDGNVFVYRVAETEILLPTQIDDLIGTDYPLTLLTCTLGGRTRVTVRCEKIGEIPAK